MAYRDGIFLVSLVCAFLQSVNIIPVAGHHVMYDNDRYMLDYHVKGSIIEFKITVSDVNGWVGLGINSNGGMGGADIFMGGVLDDNTYYGQDFHASSNSPPTLDEAQNWNATYGKREGGKTILHVHRPLNTNDVPDDKVIENKKVFILWSYNEKSHNLSLMHTNRGAEEINFFEAPPTENGSLVLQGGLFTILLTGLMAFLN